MGDEGGQPDSGLLWRHPGAEVPGKERWWYWAPLPLCGTSGRLTTEENLLSWLSEKENAGMRWMVGGRDKEAVTPGWGRVLREPQAPPLTSLPLVATSPAGCPHHSLGSPASTPSLSCLVCPGPGRQGPSVRDLATSPWWQRVREGGRIISSKRRKW